MSGDLNTSPAKTTTAEYALIYATGWDHTLGEPTGGRCVGVYRTIFAAIGARAKLLAGAVASWGPGYWVVTDADHDWRPVLLPPALLAGAKGWDGASAEAPRRA